MAKTWTTSLHQSEQCADSGSYVTDIPERGGGTTGEEEEKGGGIKTLKFFFFSFLFLNKDFSS